MNYNGLESEFIIGDLPQKKRQNIMDRFKEGKIKCLVATDVAARGIDVNDLEMVINYDIPNEAENYVHRIGRTARAGKSGKAYTFCSEQDVYSLPAIERYIGKQIPSQVADPDLLAEDKSEGVYIRTENYHEDYNDKSEYGRKKQREYEARKRNEKQGRGKGRYSSRNKAASNEYKRDRRVYGDGEADKLASMSTEERMKLYKEKYGTGSSGAKSSGKKNGSSQKNQASRKQPQKNQRTAAQHNNNKRKNEPNVNKTQNKTQKKGIFAKIKSFFGGKEK